MPNSLKLLTNNIKSTMEKMGLNQSDLARATGIAPSHISAYLSMKNAPGLEIIEAFAEALGVTVSDLLSGARAPKPVIRPPTEEDLMVAYIERSRLPKEKKEALLAILLQH